jgi:hypothetical protein
MLKTYTSSLAAFLLSVSIMAQQKVIKFDDTRKTSWDENFRVVEIKSPADNNIQKAYFYSTKSSSPQPLVVSLHTWSGDYTQDDEISKMCRDKDINYIHPDFRGPNFTFNACCSPLVMSDIDQSITWAMANARVDTSRIYVIGVSGGGYATLASFMKLKHKIRRFSAWASISDLVAWYNESTLMKNSYAENILSCTGSQKGALNEEEARSRSPLRWKTPVNRLKECDFSIYAGIYDGIQGSVPITHSINFYNKILTDMSVKDKSAFVPDKEKLDLLEFRKPLGNFGEIGGRKVCLVKKYGNLKLVIFEGGHEMLTEYAMEELMK